MTAAKQLLNSKLLKSLIPVCDLDEVNFARLEANCVVEQLDAGTQLFAEGERDNNDFYLLGGQVLLNFSSGLEKSISANTIHARRPMAPGIPRSATATAKTPVTILRFDSSLLVELMNWADKGYEVSDLDGEDDNDWMTRFLQSKVFLKLPAQNIQALMMRMEEVTVRNGQIIIRQGDDDGYYYIIKRGHCRVTRRFNPHDNGVDLAELTIGAGFGEEAILSRNRRGATVTMLSNGSLMRLTRNDFTRLLVEPLIHEAPYEDVINNPDSVFLDVRSCDDFLEDGIVGSQNIAVAELRLNIDKLDRSKQYVICSNTGSRAAAAAFLLCQQGMEATVLKQGLQSLPAGVMRGNYGSVKGDDIPLVDNVVSFKKQPGPVQEPQSQSINSEKIMDDPRVQALFGRAKRRVQHEADRTRVAEEAREQAEAAVSRLECEAEQARLDAEEARRQVELAMQQSVEAARLEAKKEAAKLRDMELGAKQAEMEVAVQQAEEEARRAHEADAARKQAEQEIERLKQEMQIALTNAQEEARKSADAMRQHTAQEIEREKEAARLRAEALVIEQAEKNIAIRRAEENASRAQASEQARLQAEAEIERLRQEFEESRLLAEQQAQLMAEVARTEAEQKATGAVRREAEQEIERVRREAEQERQRLEALAVHAAEVARAEAISEAQLNADAEALRARQAEQARIEAEQEIARLQAEAEAARQQIQAQLTSEFTRSEIEHEVARLRAEELVSKQAEIEDVAHRAEAEALRARAAEEARDRAEAEILRLKEEVEAARNQSDEAGTSGRVSIQQAAAELALQQKQTEMESISRQVAEETVRARAAAQAKYDAEAEIQRLREEVAVATLQAQTQHEREAERAAEEVNAVQLRAMQLEQKEAEIDVAIKRASLDAQRASEAELAHKYACEEIERVRAEADIACLQAKEQGKADVAASEEKARHRIEQVALQVREEARRAESAEKARQQAEQEIQRLKAEAEVQRIKSEKLIRESVKAAKRQLDQKLIRQRAAIKARRTAEIERKQAEQEIEKSLRSRATARKNPPCNTVNSDPRTDALSNDIPLDADDSADQLSSGTDAAWVSDQVMWEATLGMREDKAVEKILAPGAQVTHSRAPVHNIAAHTPPSFGQSEASRAERAKYDFRDVNPYSNTQRVEKTFVRPTRGKLRKAVYVAIGCLVLSAAGYYWSLDAAKQGDMQVTVDGYFDEDSAIGGITGQVKDTISDLGRSAKDSMTSAVRNTGVASKMKPVVIGGDTTGADVAVAKPTAPARRANEKAGRGDAGDNSKAAMTLEQRIQKKRERSEGLLRGRLERDRQQSMAQQARQSAQQDNQSSSVLPVQSGAGETVPTVEQFAPVSESQELLPIPAAGSDVTFAIGSGDQTSLIDRVLEESAASVQSTNEPQETAQVNNEIPQPISQNDAQQVDEGTATPAEASVSADGQPVEQANVQ